MCMFSALIVSIGYLEILNKQKQGPALAILITFLSDLQRSVGKAFFLKDFPTKLLRFVGKFL